MTDFLFKMFIKDYKNTSNPSVRSAYGALSGIVGIICNVLLFIGKLLAGIVSGSVAVIADAVNNLSDASSSVVSLIGFRLAKKPADEGHPYGHGRYEYIAGLVVSLLIIIIGVELMQQSIGKIIHPEKIYFGLLSIVVLIASIIVKLWMMVFSARAGKAIDSKTLIAAAADSRNDVVATTAVLLGAVASRVWDVQLDGWIGAAVSVFVIISGVMTAKDTLDPVLGRAPDKETVEKIRNRIMQYEGVLGTHDLMVHDYGVGHQFASVHVEMSAEGDAISKHEVIDSIERDFLENDGIHMIVHYDPVPPEYSELCEMLEWISAEVKKLDERITIHDLQNKDGVVSLDCVVPEDMEIGDKEINTFVKNIICAKYPECMAVVVIDHSFAEIVK